MLWFKSKPVETIPPVDEKEKERLAELRRKNPDKIPCLVRRAPSCKDKHIPEIDKIKYLVPNHYTLGQFVFVLRKRMQIKKEQAFFVFVNNVLAPHSIPMAQLYAEQKGENEFLNIVYTSESTFGQ